MASALFHLVPPFLLKLLEDDAALAYQACFLLHELDDHILLRNVIAALSQIDPSIEEASRSLGASSVKTFTSITIPLVLPAILSGMKYLFIHSMTAISATIFLVSVHWTLITTRILECMTELQFAQACAFSVVLILLVFLASGAMSLLARVLCRNGDTIGAR